MSFSSEAYLTRSRSAKCAEQNPLWKPVKLCTQIVHSNFITNYNFFRNLQEIKLLREQSLFNVTQFYLIL